MKTFVHLFILFAVASAAQAVNPEVTLQISGAVNGTIVIELAADEAPLTVANFIEYVNSGFYNGLIFHRVIPDFMIQGGGYSQTLVKKQAGPAILNESSNGLLNLRGTLAMARTLVPHSATSEFFINHTDNSFLDFGAVVYDGNNNAYYRAGYCVFGWVVSGMNVVDAIASVPTTTEGAMANVPQNDIIIQSAVMTVQTPVCAETLEGDINADCIVNLQDFFLMAQNWLVSNELTR